MGLHVVPRLIKLRQMDTEGTMMMSWGKVLALYNSFISYSPCGTSS